MRADSGFYNHARRRCKQDVRFSITIRQQPARTLIEAIAQEDWTPIPYWLRAARMSPRRPAVPLRLIVRRVKPAPGSQLALFVNSHAFITDRAGEMMELEAGHRRHAEIENATLRDLKYGVSTISGPLRRERRGSRCR